MNDRIDFTSKTPYHQQAKLILLRMINTKEYSSGTVLPNEVDLARTLEISRNTLRQVINRLAVKGLLIRKRELARPLILLVELVVTLAIG